MQGRAALRIGVIEGIGHGCEGGMGGSGLVLHRISCLDSGSEPGTDGGASAI